MSSFDAFKQDIIDQCIEKLNSIVCQTMEEGLTLDITMLFGDIMSSTFMRHFPDSKLTSYIKDKMFFATKNIMYAVKTYINTCDLEESETIKDNCFIFTVQFIKEQLSNLEKDYPIEEMLLFTRPVLLAPSAPIEDENPT
jgi:hypothetical protein